MNPRMFEDIHKFQVFYTVIKTIAILVMHALIFFKRSFNELFHEISMSINLFIVNLNLSVPMRINISKTLASIQTNGRVSIPFKPTIMFKTESFGSVFIITILYRAFIHIRNINKPLSVCQGLN